MAFSQIADGLVNQRLISQHATHGLPTAGQWGTMGYKQSTSLNLMTQEKYKHILEASMLHVTDSKAVTRHV